MQWRKKDFTWKVPTPKVVLTCYSTNVPRKLNENEENYRGCASPVTPPQCKHYPFADLEGCRGHPPDSFLIFMQFFRKNDLALLKFEKWDSDTLVLEI